jgi:hypothetical protein
MRYGAFGFLGIGICGELTDDDTRLGEDCSDFQLAAHGLNEARESADLHVRAAFQPRDYGLVFAQAFGQLLLCGGTRDSGDMPARNSLKFPGIKINPSLRSCAVKAK